MLTLEAYHPVEHKRQRGVLSFLTDDFQITGSMPPHSTSLLQEGAAFKSFLLVESGTFKETEITKELTTSTGAAGATGTRNLADNLSDLKAQVAANQKGIQLVSELIDTYGLKVVQAYMDYIQKNAEVAVRDMLKEIAKTTKER